MSAPSTGRPRVSNVTKSLRRYARTTRKLAEILDELSASPHWPVGTLVTGDELVRQARVLADSLTLFASLDVEQRRARYAEPPEPETMHRAPRQPRGP